MECTCTAPSLNFNSPLLNPFERLRLRLHPDGYFFDQYGNRYNAIANELVPWIQETSPIKTDVSTLGGALKIESYKKSS